MSSDELAMEAWPSLLDWLSALSYIPQQCSQRLFYDVGN